MAGGELMIHAVETYLTMRRAVGFELSNAGYLLRRFARFAPERSFHRDARLRYDSSPVIDVFVIAKVAAACGLRTVTGGFPPTVRST